MTILDLLKAVKDQTLPKEALELLRDEMVHLHTECQLELADIEKESAMWIYERTKPDVSDISIKRAWKATTKGQREIELNRWIKALAKELDSLKSRLYSIF